MSVFRQGLRDLMRLILDAEVSKKAARERAMQLLKQNLSPDQLKQFERSGHFEVIGGDSARRYRIRRGHQMNVELLDKNGRRFCCLCFRPEGTLATADVMLAQKFALELFEVQALKVANKVPVLDRLEDSDRRQS